MFKLATIAAMAIAFAMPASAVTISAYETVNGASIASTLNGPGVVSADLTRGNGLQEIGNANHFRSRFWTVGGDATTALSNNDYIEWGFSATGAYDLDTLSLRYDRNDNGPQSIAIFASYDGGAFTQIFTDTTVTTTIEIANVNLSGTTATSATFRLVGWDASNSGGRFWLRNNGVGPSNDYGVVLSGELAVVPVPASLPLMIGALGLFGLTRRKS